ncbi:MAG: hypothetical protein KGS48_08170 [Bacteroidetes bacterium]|nr:hypothetical protein [Bacteroidota bacterium]
MNKIYRILPLLAILWTGCASDAGQTKGSKGPNSPEEVLNALAGHWVNIDFCGRANQYGSVLQAMNETHLPYAYAFSFSPVFKDSVECFNGFENFKLPFKMRADTLEIVGARGEKTSIFMVLGNKEKEMDITVFDAAPSGTYIDRYIKSKAGAADGYRSFLTALNHNLFSGAFTRVGKPSENNILFTPGGFIQKFKDYDRYEICTGGDCFVAGPYLDVITLRNSKKEGSEKICSFKYSAKHDTLTIYNLVEQNPEEKGTFVLGKPLYAFTRKPAE